MKYNIPQNFDELDRKLLRLHYRFITYEISELAACCESLRRLAQTPNANFRVNIGSFIDQKEDSIDFVYDPMFDFDREQFVQWLYDYSAAKLLVMRAWQAHARIRFPELQKLPIWAPVWRRAMRGMGPLNRLGRALQSIYWKIAARIVPSSRQ